MAETDSWKELRTAEDVSELMELAGEFHDCFVSGFAYDPLARAVEGDESLSRDTRETDSLIIRFRFDAVDSNGEWPEVELRFCELDRISFDPESFTMPLHEAHLERVGGAWVLVNEEPLSDEERRSIRSLRSGLLVIAGEASWRRAGGMFWKDEVRHRRMKDIVSFAREQLNVLEERRFGLFLEPWVGDVMRDLGFEMDCGESFVNKYGFAESDGPERLLAELDRIDDVDVLGNGIFSTWRYWNHWAMRPMGEGEEEWLRIALEHLVRLCEGR